MTASLLLATRDPARAAAFKAALHGAGPWSLQSPAQGLADIRQALKRRAPDLLLVDLALAELALADGPLLELLRPQRSAGPLASAPWRTQLLLLADDEHEARLQPALLAGTDGVYVLSRHTPQALRQQVGELLDRGASVEPWLAERLLAHFVEELEGRNDLSVADLSNPLSLAPAERSLLHRLAAGDGLAELASLQAVSPREICSRVRQLYRKMQLVLHAGDLSLA